MKELPLQADGSKQARWYRPDVAETLRAQVNHALGFLGIEVVRYSSVRHPVGRRMKLLRTLGIDLVLDVGANNGQYADELRRHGYRGRIVSFEPLHGPFRILSKRAIKDAAWEAHNVGLGAVATAGFMNVSQNSVSSSMLPILPTHEQNAPASRYVGTEKVRLQRLDVIAKREVAAAAATLLKLDVQGYEQEVLNGASGILRHLSALQIEFSLVPLYSGAPDPLDLLSRLAAERFRLIGIEPGFTSRDGRLLQADGIFLRSSGEQQAGESRNG